MYFDFKVPIPEEKGKIFERVIKGVTYINYEYDRVYKPDKKYNIPKRTTIGKKCDDDPGMMYPNPNFLTYFPDAELPADEGRMERSSCLRIGTFMVLEKLMMESMLDKLVASIYNDDRGTGLFLDLASYYLTTENNAGQYYPDYNRNEAPSSVLHAMAKALETSMDYLYTGIEEDEDPDVLEAITALRRIKSRAALKMIVKNIKNVEECEKALLDGAK